MRLDKYLKTALIFKTRSGGEKNIENGGVLLNGKIAKPASQVKEGDLITIRTLEKETTYKILQLLEKNVSRQMAREIDVPREKKYSQDHDNNVSLVISMTCGKNKLLFMGDAMEARIDEIIDSDFSDYGFIKMPHHGDYFENCGELLDKIKPSSVAITNSKKNPSDAKTLTAIKSRNIVAYETRYGGIHIDVNENGIKVIQ